MGISSLAVMFNSLSLQWDRPAALPQLSSTAKATSSHQRKPAERASDAPEHLGSLGQMQVQE